MDIQLPFYATWFLMILGIVTNMLAKVNKINHESPPDIKWKDILRTFFKKEWASYAMSFIFTGVIAFSFEFMKRFDHSSQQELNKYAKYIPFAVLFFYLLGFANQWAFYRLMGRIYSKAGVDTKILEEDRKAQV